jgi:hypothetical protein
MTSQGQELTDRAESVSRGVRLEIDGVSRVLN